LEKILHAAKRNSYRRRLFGSYFLVFIIFSVSVLLFQYKREKNFKEEKLMQSLHDNSELVNKYINAHQVIAADSLILLDSLMKITNEEIRLTIIDKYGNVLYDSKVGAYPDFDNHLNRPEVQQSLKKKFGYSVRYSSSIGHDFFYYSRKYDDYYIRSAVSYDIETIQLLKADNLFIYFILLLFIVVSLFIVLFSGKLSNSINKLKDFAIHAAEDKDLEGRYEFPNNELGVIGEKIVSIFDKNQKTQRKLLTEREKLYNHLQISKEGLAFFTKKKKHFLVNNYFIQFINFISEVSDIKPNEIFSVNDFKEITEFIDEELALDQYDAGNVHHSKEIILSRDNRYFKVTVIILKDRSFEISINDITQSETQKNLKQQMTNNIAHELKTPVASIQGYMETMLNSNKLDEERKRFFIERSYTQSQRLSHLITDISLLTKIEEASTLFDKQRLHINEIVESVLADVQLKLEQQNVKINTVFDKNISIKGNRSLLYSVFRNLVDNSLSYAGENISITIQNYFEDNFYYYFSYSDTGVGISEEHLNRIFERFYRVDKGRSRKQGGTGLGLAIVKNAILFHGGEISAKTSQNGGVEFLFTLKKII